MVTSYVRNATCQRNAAKECPLPSKALHKPRVGIYSGAFDPVHAGHVAFALQALEQANLDELVFLPERRPRGKPSVEHYAHRVAMIKRALQPHAALSVMEMVEATYSVTRTLPSLRQVYRGADLVMIVGSDVALGVQQWPHVKQLLRCVELVVGVRSQHEHHAVEAAIDSWKIQPRALHIIDSFASDVSSSQIREALREDKRTKGLLMSVERYARREWLYVSPGTITR